ncbi:uncharacterized protein [Henckelia pumila]|uniref:uncharacterized protein n=1 Tax=Henckelia pumila TaxID=405737 RepID=UPI003C6DEAB5
MDADEDPLDQEDVSAAAASVAVGVVNTTDNTVDEEYDMDAAHSLTFYSGDAAATWPLLAHRGLLDERNIDVRSYDRYNLIDFLKLRQLYSTVVVVISYCKRVILEFYANLTSSIEDPESAKYGLVYLRGRLFEFTPAVINSHYSTPDVDEGNPPEINEVITVLTGGMVKKFSDHFSAAKLTSFYSALHKIAVRNWTPSSNSTVITRPQAIILYAIGTGSHFNFGRMVFKTVLQFANGGLKSTKLPFSSLIYGILESQAFIRNITEDLTDQPEILKLAAGLLKGNRVMDLPWTATPTPAGDMDGVAPDVSNTGDNTEETVPTPTSLEFTTATIQLLMTRAEEKIAQAQEDIAFYRTVLADCRRQLGICSCYPPCYDMKDNTSGENFKIQGEKSF